MRVLYLNFDPGIPVFGPKGASVHVRSIAEAMVRAGSEVRILAHRRGDGSATAFNVVEISDAQGVALREIVERSIRDWRPDVVYERYALVDPAGVEACRKLVVTHLLEVNSPLPEEASQYRGLADQRSAREKTSRCFTLTSGVLVVSRGLADYVRGYGVGAERIHLLPNGIDPRLFETPAVTPASPTERPGFTLGFCGTLRPWHGIDQLIRIFLVVARAIPGARLLVVGDGPGRGMIEDAVEAHGLSSQVEITGPLDHREIPGQLRRFDVALAPYPRIEPFYFSPLKIYEYMAAAIPVVASRQGDIPHIISHGVTGLLHEPEDLVTAMQQVLDLHSDPLRARRIGTAAREHVLAHDTWPSRADTVLKLAADLGPVREVTS
jgi:glycosyltransferase involved in cell wall biosynthesis